MYAKTIYPWLDPEYDDGESLENMSDFELLYWIDDASRDDPSLPAMLAEAAHRELTDSNGEPY